MKKRLKRNICNLDNYAVLSRVEDLSTHWKSHIGDALGYACCFWTRHLIKTPNSGHDAEEVQKAINEFFTTYLLFWIEVLAIMGNLDTGVYAINDIQQWYISVSCDDFVFKNPYIYSLFRQVWSASGQMIVNSYSWNILIPSITLPLRSITMLFHSLLPHLGSMSVIA